MSLSKLSGKPVVQYADVGGPVVVGQRVSVLPLNHPDTYNVTNGYPAWTSAVLRIGDNGEFETKNTIYVPSNNEYVV